jgi:hypothetical protein
MVALEINLLVSIKIFKCTHHLTQHSPFKTTISLPGIYSASYRYTLDMCTCTQRQYIQEEFAMLFITAKDGKQVRSQAKYINTGEFFSHYKDSK